MAGLASAFAISFGRSALAAGETTCNDLAMSSLGMQECLEAVQDRSGWSDRVVTRDDREGRAMGLACGFFVSGAGYPIYRSRTPHCTVEVKLDESGGGVQVRSGAAEIGQGCETMLATIVAETLGVPLEVVRVKSGDTDLALDLGAYSSRTTLMTGHAARFLRTSLGTARIMFLVRSGVEVSCCPLAVLLAPWLSPFAPQHAAVRRPQTSVMLGSFLLSLKMTLSNTIHTHENYIH